MAVVLVELAVLAVASGIEVSGSPLACENPLRAPSPEMLLGMPINPPPLPSVLQHESVYDLGHLVAEAEEFAAGAEGRPLSQSRYHPPTPLDPLLTPRRLSAIRGAP